MTQAAALRAHPKAVPISRAANCGAAGPRRALRCPPGAPKGTAILRRVSPAEGKEEPLTLEKRSDGKEQDRAGTRLGPLDLDWK